MAASTTLTFSKTTCGVVYRDTRDDGTNGIMSLAFYGIRCLVAGDTPSRPDLLQAFEDVGAAQMLDDLETFEDCIGYEVALDEVGPKRFDMRVDSKGGNLTRSGWGVLGGRQIDAAQPLGFRALGYTLLCKWSDRPAVLAAISDAGRYLSITAPYVRTDNQVELYLEVASEV